MSMSSTTPPLISIITPSFNQGKYIEQTILSVINQDYPNIEYIVIDGGSTDETREILARYETRLSWVSEPDRGQADAINKGFQRASGVIFAWLNADDLYTPGAVSTVMRYFEEHPEVHFVYGDALALDENGHSYGIRTHVRETTLDELINVGDYIVQPAVFWRADLWRDIGLLDETLHYTLDYEYWMRTARHYKPVYIPVCLAQERLYAQAKTFMGAIKRLEEIEMVARRNGGAGIPISMREEAAANYAVRGFAKVARIQAEGIADLRLALQLRPPFIRFLKYFCILFFFGSGSLSRFWLNLNRIRWRRKQHVTFPITTKDY
jgi:glycosyltransferase involved in cell wall biosynthesis